MSLRIRPYRGRVFIAAGIGLALAATLCQAQDMGTPPGTVTPLIAAALAPSLSLAHDVILDDQATAPRQQPSDPVAEAAPSRRGVLLPLYVSFAALQALDAHSTIRALQAGGTEQNPMLRGIAGRPAALVALKAGVAASTILLTEKLRVKNRTGAVVLMAVLNSFYATIVARNYQAIR